MTILLLRSLPWLLVAFAGGMVLSPIAKESVGYISPFMILAIGILIVALGICLRILWPCIWNTKATRRDE